MAGADPLTGALERLPGVRAASALLEPPHGPRIYLAVSSDADPEAIREAVIALLEDQGIPLAPARVHVGVAPTPAADTTILPALALDGLETHRTGGGVRCTVTLRSRARTTSGSAGEPDTRTGRARAAVRACLRAVESLDPDLRLGMEGVKVMDLFGQEGVLVLVEATAGRTHVHLPGTALAERSVEEAGCLATLAALRSWRL